MPGRSEISSADPRYQYTSKERDTETGLDYFGARFYDSWSCQFHSIDPHGDLYQPLSPYVYAGDNPIGFVDRTGMDSTDSQNRTGSDQLPPQGPVTLAGPQEVPLAPNGFGESPTSPMSQWLTSFSNFLDKTSDVSLGGSALFIVGGFATGTEEIAGPIGVGLADLSYYSEVGSVSLKTINFLAYGQGNRNEITEGLKKVATEGAFTLIARELRAGLSLTHTEEGEKEALGFGLDAIFMTGPQNTNARNYSPGPVYVHPDVTSYSRKGW